MTTPAPDTPTDEAAAAGSPAKLDATVPHGARIWNYWLGGKDNFAVDRAVGDQVQEVFPDIVPIARASRAFLVRAVTCLVGEAGIRQFLDIGTGLPTADNTHEVAQRLAPESRVVYVDNDPMVLVHARALLTSDLRGVTDYIDADVRDPDKILQGAANTLDFDQPVALMLLGILGNVVDYSEALRIVERLVVAVPSGSYLVVNDGANITSPTARDAIDKIGAEAGSPYITRTPKEIERFFDGLELLPPGVVSTPLWRPTPGANPAPLDVCCGVARKP
jgi:hypothetical protein